MFNVFFSIVTFQCSLLAADLIEKRLESNALSLVRGFSF